MSKKSLRLALASLTAALMLCISTAFAETVTHAQALSAIWKGLYAETGFSQEDFALSQLVSGNGEWSFSTTLKSHPEDEDGLYVGTLRANGALDILQKPSKISLDRRLETQLKECFNRDNCYIRLAEVCEKWKPIISALTDEEAEGIFDKYRAVVESGIRLPDSGTLHFDAAYDCALDALSREEGWSDESARLYRLCISAYYSPDDIGKPVYLFYFERHSMFENEYSTDKAMKNYEKKLESYFGSQRCRINR
ncbi:MAG: hypothetical protein PHI27_03475 [Eubacteriales bacterium]|nr:hypothetical protein [Eubacteriales bacterium]MDD3881296.1 hypothetical protein [Eubacteriales bacterium]MDD4512214.1 hypothetical protein [Eubacteriales bacterium]